MNYPEQLLHYIWKYKLYPNPNFVSSEGDEIEIIDAGILNTDAGPDFFNAKIKIEDKVWAGNIEIHKSSSDWKKHNHHSDPAYNSVILHVVEKIDCEIYTYQKRKVPQAVIEIPDNIRIDYAHLLLSDSPIPCSNKLKYVEKAHLNPWLSALLAERLERKINDIYTVLDKFNNSWDETFYVLLSRNFGFGLNANEFERLALSLPYFYIQKHSDNIFQIEALLFGQAGLLEDESLTDDYYLQLKKEYRFLKKKYTLKNLNGFIFKSLRVRPQGFPQVRIAQLAAVLQQTKRLFSHILEKEDENLLRLFFHINASEYWQTHYTFGKPSKKISKYPGDASINVILINTVVPLLFAYGKKNNIEKYCTRALTILEELKPERNSIITEFRKHNITPKNAADTQALIQLKKEYCDKKKCLYCKIGYQILSGKIKTD
ncbi:MAG: DUF2851 family protein [Dysgonamonadaceae bacterium]|nr:DUF2851 family protein [Dysgonamonadaceae bacterium]MDD3355634.1 DUF2851 family protein [Dysgonamonadaceae bacterium]MDD3726883.1 DUF2851 family protein [Dysgonamonadaceae bacterium]MDD4246333.1 DUF2851 family protein [Dysgonamonadaceae bacterium]MDD4605949.1 DUF2851 family protein [Dysgonamonadaceae bacterium]